MTTWQATKQRRRSMEDTLDVIERITREHMHGKHRVAWEDIIKQARAIRASLAGSVARY